MCLRVCVCEKERVRLTLDVFGWAFMRIRGALKFVFQKLTCVIDSVVKPHKE